MRACLYDGLNNELQYQRKNELRVLVTALGGELGQAIVKALAAGQPRLLHVSAATLVADGIASLFAQEFHKVPYARDQVYVAD